jgi:flagellar motor switch protein FliN/FliY
MTTDELAENVYRSFSDAFFGALVAAISDASGSSWLLSAVPDAEKTSDESESVRVNVTVEGSLGGELLLQFRHADAAVLAAKCLQQPTAEFGTEQSDALVKFVQAGMGKFSSAVVEEYGIFTSTVSIASEPASDSAHAVEMTAADDGGNRVSMVMYLNPRLAEALSLEAAKKSENETNQRSGGTAGEETVSNPEPLNLQLVMDVELSVTLRFGQRQLALREVLELTSGSVIELDRQVEEPVELLLEGKVIARGEAVVIDGNYGLRVTEVPQPISPPVLR